MRTVRLAATLFLLALACREQEPRRASSGVLSDGEAPAAPLEVQKGRALFYSSELEGKVSASGEEMHNEEFVAAHPSWPFGTLVRVTNVENGNAVTVRIIDRGPSRPSLQQGVVIDLSRAAGRQLGLTDGKGVAEVRLEVIRWGKKRR